MIDLHVQTDATLTVTPRPAGVTGDWPRGLEAPLFVVTAWNPGAARPGLEENRRRQRLLERDLDLLGARRWKAIGRDPEFDHFEESAAAAGLDEGDVRALGARYGQDAIFVWTPLVLCVVSCDGPRQLSRGWSVELTRSTRPASRGHRGNGGGGARARA